MKNLLKSMIFSWTSLFVLCSIILLGSVLPLGKITDIKVFDLDKLLHFIAYAMMALVIFGILKERYNLKISKIVLFTLISSLVYGILVELVQYFIPYREAEILDVYFNSLGAITGIIIGKVVI